MTGLLVLVLVTLLVLDDLGIPGEHRKARRRVFEFLRS